MARRHENTSFACLHCLACVPACTNGGYRNHCPKCLWSKHMDIEPGDRASDCRGPMRPSSIEHRSHKGLVIVHRCTRCGFVRANRIADDREQGDDIGQIVAVMTGTL